MLTPYIDKIEQLGTKPLKSSPYNMLLPFPSLHPICSIYLKANGGC